MTNLPTQSITRNTLQLIHGVRRLSWDEIHERCDEGERLYAADILSPRLRDWAVQRVGIYLFTRRGLGHGREAERLKLLTEWYLRVRRYEVPKEQKKAIESIHRAVSWKSKRSVVEPSEDTIQKMMAAGLSIHDFARHNIYRMNIARAKISRAVETLGKEGASITRHALERLTGCSPRTINKHSDLWIHLRPTEHMQQIGPRLYHRGVVGAAQKQEVQEAEASKIVQMPENRPIEKPPCSGRRVEIFPGARKSSTKLTKRQRKIIHLKFQSADPKIRVDFDTGEVFGFEPRGSPAIGV